MLIADLEQLLVEQKAIASRFLKRYVIVDLYLPKNIADPSALSLLLINDGQDLEEMGLAEMLNRQLEAAELPPVLCIGIHANKDRRHEYGVASRADYEGRGAKAAAFQQFVCNELLPYLYSEYALTSFRRKGYCGFSLGGLAAFDTVWNHPDLFSVAGVFSGSLWWRSKPLNKDYNDDTDRIIHQVVRNGSFHPGLRFYFTTGSQDETADRNGNGIIDSIDDTQDLIRELKAQGYADDAIRYLNFDDGRHDVATWGKAMPDFLAWSLNEMADA